MKKKICVVSGSRADYGLLCWLMKEIKQSRDLELIPVVTGAHLSKKFGYTIEEIINDGFSDVVKIEVPDGDTSAYGIANTMSIITNKFAEFFNKEKIDILVLLGDRFEMLAVASAATPFNIPVAHIGGGEITEGAIDDNIRHCLTKLSHLHFVITKECARRVERMGEEPWRVHTVGSPRMDYLNGIKLKSKEELSSHLGVNFKDKTILAVYHPVTLETQNTQTQINNLVETIKKIGVETIMFYPNMDTSSDIIINKIEEFAKNNNKVKLFRPLKRVDYLSVLGAVDVLVGNSSIGIVEAPSFKLPVVNIGNRQKSRDHTDNIINTGYSIEDITQGIEKGLFDSKFRESLEGLKNPYGDGKASQRIVKILESINLEKFSIMKKNSFD